MTLLLFILQCSVVCLMILVFKLIVCNSWFISIPCSSCSEDSHSKDMKEQSERVRVVRGGARRLEEEAQGEIKLHWVQGGDFMFQVL